MVTLPLNITTSFCCLVFSAARLHLTGCYIPFILVIGHKNKHNISSSVPKNPVRSILILVEHDGKNGQHYLIWRSAKAISEFPSLNPRPNFFIICELKSHFARLMYTCTWARLTTKVKNKGLLTCVWNPRAIPCARDVRGSDLALRKGAKWRGGLQWPKWNSNLCSSFLS